APTLLPPFSIQLPPPPRPTLFPYTTLFRSVPRPCDPFDQWRHPYAARLTCMAHTTARTRLIHSSALAPRRGWGWSVMDRLLRFRSEEHTSELQSLRHLVCRLLLEKKKKKDV